MQQIVTVTVPGGYVRQLLDQVKDQGYDIDELLASVGIDPQEISQQTAFPADKFGALYQRVMYVTQDEYFGMLSGGRLPNGTFRMMCHAIISCKNLGHAVSRASDFHEIVRGTRIKPKLERQGEVAKISFAGVDRLEDLDVGRWVAAEPPARIYTSLSMWHHFVSWLIGERVELQATRFTFPALGVSANLHTRFRSDIKFDQPENALIFPAYYLDYPLVQTEKTLHGFLKTAPYQLLVMVDDDNSLKTQVIALIGRDSSRLPPSAEQVSRLLNMSVSTLRRRLLDENTSYQKIKDECRRESALNYMNSPQLSLNDVAELMGFDEPSAFFRTFKRWTGMTPSQYRESADYLQQLGR